MPLHRNKLKEIYGTLKSGGFERTYDDFESRFAGSNNYSYRKKIYDLMFANGDVDAPSYEDWMKELHFVQTVKKATPKAVAKQPATEDKTTKLLDSVQSTLNENRRVQNRMDYAMGKTGLKTPETNLGWKGKSTLGFGGNVVETKRRNYVTGRDETVYLTESGNEYGSRAMADVEQGQLDEARFMRENKRAYLMREKERIEREMNQRRGEVKRAEEEEYKKIWDGPLKYLSSMPRGGGVGFNPSADNLGVWGDKKYKTLNAQLKQVEDALATLDEAEAGKKSDAWIADSSNAWERNAKKLAGFGGGAWRGLAHSVGKISTWDFGITDMETNKSVLDAANAVDKGTEATKEDQELLDLVAYKNMVEKESEPYLGYGYTAGSITGESLPFMLEMAINPASGVGKGAMKASMRGMLKKYGKEKLKSNFKKYLLAKAGARVAGDVAGAHAMALTTGQGRVIADTMRRLTGDVQYGVNDNGQIVYSGRKVDVDGLAEAYLKSFESQAIENHSEMLGEYFAPLLTRAGKAIGKPIGKGLEKLRLGGVNRFIEDVGASKTAKLIDDFSKKTQWNGSIGEYAEEVAGGIENAMIVGDQTLDTDEQTGVFNLEKNIETFLGVGLMGGFMFGAKLASYRGPKRGALQEMEAAGNRVDRALGGKMQARAQWGEWRSKLLLGNEEEKKNTLREIMDNEKLPIQFRNAVADFSRAAQKYEGLCRAEQSKRLEGSADPVGSSLDDAADAGYELNDPQEMTRTRLALENERERMAAYLGVEADQVDATVGENLFDYVDDLRNRGVTGEELNRVMDYARARSRYEGMQMRLEDDTNTRIDNVHANMARYAHRENGTVQTGAVKTKDGSRPVWIVSGNLVFEGEGKDRGVNPVKSDESIFVIDAKTGQVEMHPATDFVSLGEPVSAEEVNAYYESSVREQMKKAFEANTHAELSEEKPAEDGELAPANETEGAAVEPAEGNATESTAENVAEPAKPAYEVGDVVTLEAEDGPVSVEVQAVTADGVEVRTDEPWRGQVVQVIPTEEFEGMMKKPVEEAGVGVEESSAAESDRYTEGSPERVEAGDNLIVTDEEGNDRSLKVVRRVSMRPSEKGGLEPQEDANGKIVELVDDATGETVRMWDSELAERTKGYMRPVSGSEVESGESSEGQQENPQQGVMPSPKSTEGEGVEQAEQAAPAAEPAQPKRDEIPVDEKTGEPVYEAADPGAAWDALVEEAEGDEELAMETVNAMVRDMEEKVKKAKNAKLRAGATAHEKMEAQKERKRRIAEAEERLESWKRIAGVKAERAAAAESPATVETPAAEEATPVQEGAQTPVQEGAQTPLQEGARGGVQVPHADSTGQEATQDSVTGAAPVAEQTGTTPKGVEAIPTRKNNKGEEEVLYHKVPVARTMADLYDGGMDQEEIDGFVEANSAEAAREVKRIEGKKPKMTTNKAKYMEAKRAWQAELDEAREKEAYWKEVGKEVKRVTHRDEAPVSAEGRGHEAALGEDMPKDEPMDVYEVVASALGRGRIKITPESFRAETGYSVNDQKKYPGMVASAENGGVSVERAAEMLMEDAEMAGFPSDDYTIRQAIIEVLQDGHPAGYISRRREEARRRAAERDEREREEYYQDRYGMNADDGMAYEETAVPNALNQYGGVSEDELAAQSAEAAEAERMKREEDEQGNRGEEGGQQMAGKEEGAGNEAASEVEEMPAAHEPAVDSSMPKTSFTQNEAADFVDKMEARAESVPEMELTIENWDSLFGEDGRVETPIGEVKMGENQFAKLMRQGRNGKLGMIKPTLESPDIIIEQASMAKEGDVTERPSSYLFIKAFTKPDGGRFYYFTSVSVSRDGKEVIISNQEKSRNKILRLMTEESVIWRTPNDAATSSAEKQGLDYAHPNNAEDETKGSGITPQSTSSAGKVTESKETEQGKGENAGDVPASNYKRMHWDENNSLEELEARREYLRNFNRADLSPAYAEEQRALDELKERYPRDGEKSLEYVPYDEKAKVYSKYEPQIRKEVKEYEDEWFELGSLVAKKKRAAKAKLEGFREEQSAPGKAEQVEDSEAKITESKETEQVGERDKAEGEEAEVSKDETPKEYKYRRNSDIYTLPDGYLRLGKDERGFDVAFYDHPLSRKEVERFHMGPITESNELVGKVYEVTRGLVTITYRVVGAEDGFVLFTDNGSFDYRTLPYYKFMDWVVAKGKEVGMEVKASGKAREARAKDGTQPVSESEAGLRDALVDVARAAGVEVVTDSKEGQRVLDEVNGKARLSAKQKRALETASLSQSEKDHSTVVSSADGAKVLNNLDILAKELLGKSNRPKTFLGDVAKAIGASNKGSSSQYATFETKNGTVVTIRLANHNASTKRMDDAGQDNAISIVITNKPNEGIQDGGDAHIVEFYYNALKLGRADGHPLAEIVRSIQQALYSGEYKDTTGLAERQEVNTTFENLREHRVFHGSGAEFDAFDHSHMGEGEGAQAYGWGTYVTEVEGIGRMYASQNKGRISYKGKSVQEIQKLYEEGVSPYNVVYSVVIEMEGGLDFSQAKEMLESDWRSSLEYEVAEGDGEYADGWRQNLSELASLEESDFSKKEGSHLYTVEIPNDNGSNYLHWEKPVSKEQQNRILNQLRSEGIILDGVSDDFYNGTSNSWNSGETLYGLLDYCFTDVNSNEDSQKAVSEFLMRCGIAGVSYPAEARSGGREDGARNFVLFNEKDAQITDHVRFFKTENGEAYGFTVGGKIYLDPKIATTETAVHELTHLWADMLRKENPKEWKHVVELMKGTPVWDEVKAKYPELKTEDEIADEVLAHYSGRRGAERLRAEQQRLAREEGVSMLDRASAVAAIERVKDALNSFWKKVADLLGIHFKSAEEVADAALADILNGRVKLTAAEGMKEDRKELVAVHNITKDKLKQAMELGGFPMPSIAITKAGVGHTSFGDISLVFDKESINPTDKRNKVYGEDAWTPVFPGVGYKLNDKKTAEIYRRANNVAREKDLPFYNPAMFHPDNYINKVGANGVTDLVEYFKNSYDAKQMYLAEMGNAVTEYVKREEEKYSPKHIRLYEKMLEEIGLERLQNESLEELRDEIKRLYKEYGDVDIDQKPQRVERAYLDGAKRKAVDYALHGNRNVVDDVFATQREIDGRIDQQQFEEWLGEMFSGIVEKKGVRNDKDAYTPSGNARKWEQLYDEITLDNVVAAMQKQAAKGGEGLFGRNIFGSAQAEYKSIDEIRKAAKERIRTINEEEYQTQRSAITDRLSAIEIPGSGSGFLGSMEMEQHIHDAVSKSHTAKGIHKYLKKFYPGITMETAEEIADIVQDIQHMSARYFEAKPYRAVGFDEVKLAVVPSDMDAALKERLEQMGIEVRTYASGDQAQRKQVVDEATEELRIRFQLVGEKGEKNMVSPLEMSEEEKHERGVQLVNAPAVDVASGQIVKTDKLSARKAAEQWWEEHVPSPLHYQTEIGEVVIDDNSIGNSLAHRYGQAKLDAITSLEEGFVNAVYLGSMKDFSRDGNVFNHYFAYPINYDGKRNYVFCRALNDANGNRLYVHEVFVADKIEKGNTLQTAASQPHGGIALYKDILANVLDAAKVAQSSDTTNEGLSNVLKEQVGQDKTSGNTSDGGVSLLDVDGKPIVVKAEDGSVELNYNTWQAEKEQAVEALGGDAAGVEGHVSLGEDLEAVNERFNEQLDEFILDNADKINFDLGTPSEKLLLAGVADRPIRLHGSKVAKKMKKHGFAIEELRNLPRAVANPIAVFDNLGREGNRSVLTELRTVNGNFLVTIDLGKGTEADFDIVSSVFGKRRDSVAGWINKGYMRYVDKEKALNYLHLSAPIAEASDKAELSSAAKVVEEFENPNVQGQETDDASYREVEQGELLDELRKASKEGRTVRVYRTMQVIDGKLYSPMAKKVAGQETSEIKFRWEAAEEHPELARRGDGSKAMPNEDSFYITIDKGQGKGALTVAYNPYTHTSRTVLNDQFSSAFVRPNLVVVEVEVPESELEGLYKAEKAKDSVGEMSWHSGAVSGKLAELGNPRKVILSRYDRPVRILTKKEEAELIAKQLEGTGIAMPYNLVTPQVREELEKLGVKIDEKPSGSVSKNASFGKAEYVTDEQIEAMNGRLQANAVSSPEAMTEAARALSEQLGVPVEIVTDVDSITHPNEAVEVKRRRAKGWYDKRTGKVTIVVPNHLDVEDVAATVFHEVVAHRGLRELVGEQGYDEFLMEVFNHSKADVRERMMALAGKHGWDIPKAVDEYLGGLAERGFGDFSEAERGMWTWLKEKVLEAIDKFIGTLKLPKSVKLGDNELRYLLWRSHENLRAGREGMVKRAMDVAKRYELGLLENEAGERMIAGQETYRSAENRGNTRALPIRERAKAVAHLKPVLVERNEMSKEELRQIYNALPDAVKDGRSISFFHSAFKKNYKEGGLFAQVLPKLNEILKGSVFAYSEKDNRGGEVRPDGTVHKYHPNANAFDNYVGKVEIDGKEYYVRITVQEQQGQVGTHSFFVTSVDVYEKPVNGLSVPNFPSGESDHQRVVDAKLRQFFDEARREDKASEEEDLYRTAYHEAAARDAYERRVKSGLYQSREALQDSMLGLRTAMEEVLKAEGNGYSGRVEDIPGFENAYLGENRLSSVNQAEVDEFGRRQFKPLLEIAASFGSSKEARQALTDYMMAKHGLERNALMRERAKKKAMEELEGDALQKKLDSIEKRDFAGLTALTGKKKVVDAEQAARKMVADFEQASGQNGDPNRIDKLWKAVRGVTGATLKKMKDSGLITKEQFDEISGMYDFYIPLRGFDGQTAEDVYDYLGHGGNGSAFTSPIKKAEGRKSKADDPFAYMAAMAESAIMQGNRNVLVKQKFLNFVLNHPSDLVSVSDLWLRYDAAAGEWRVAQSGDIAGTEKLEEGDSPEEVERKMAVFEERMQAEAEAHPKEYKRQKEHPEIPYRVVEKQDLREHQVIVKRNGRDYVLTINGSPRAAQALNGLTNPNLDVSGVAGTLMNGVRNTTNYLSQVYTTRNPNFVGSNWVRDAVYSNIMAGLKEDKKYGLEFSKAWLEANPGSMIKLYYLYEHGKLDMNNEKQRLFAEFMANGGETGYMSFRQIEERKNEIERQLKLYGGKMSLKKGWSDAWNLVDYANRVVENQSRFAAYMASRRSGRTIDRSIYDAKEITVNFNKKGAGSTFYNAKNQTLAGKVAGGVSGIGRFGFAFWNAAIQGTTNFARFVKRNPKKGVAVSLATMALGYVVPLFASIFHDDDDDKEGSGYFDLPDAVRRDNFVFRFPGMDSWITIPLPVEYRALYGLGELTATAMYRASIGMPMTAGEIAGQAMGQISQLMPLDLSEGGGMDFTWGASGNFNALAPSAVKPVAEAWTNKSWTGLSVYKDTPYNKQDPEWTKAFKNTNTFLVKMCKQLNEWTGGDSVKGGAVDLNPAVMEHLLKGYLGGYMQTANQFGKLGETVFGDRENEFRNWPVVSRFLQEGDERTKWRAVTERYFNLKKEAEETDRQLKRYKRLTELGEDHQADIDELIKTDAYKRMEVYDFFENDIQKIQDVLKRNDLSDEERKQVEGELNEIRLELLKAVDELGNLTGLGTGRLGAVTGDLLAE